MAGKISGKNKIFIAVFAVLVIAILAILIVSVSLTKQNQTVAVYDITENSVLFNSDTNLVDVTGGGKIEKRWDDKYYFVKTDTEIVSELGYNPVVYDKENDALDVFGSGYQIFSSGNVAKKSEKMTISFEDNDQTFYKLADRIYLIVSDEIKSQDGSIYANKYLIVYIDKQGNASLLNDLLNIKTINPMILLYGDYTFDVANETLTIMGSTIDLKMVDGSTNEYVAQTDAQKQQDEMNSLVTAYNKLVTDFSEYVENSSVTASGSSGTTTVIDGTSTSSGTASSGTTGSTGSSSSVAVAANSTNLEKRISLRGAVAYPTYIDVTYVVTDPENKYQVVYLLVTGNINGTQQTQKILVDKYVTGYRISGLAPKNEYSISMGRVAIETDDDGERSLEDDIEDVINVRTADSGMAITVDKISGGKVYFTFKASESFTLSAGNIALYADDTKVGEVAIDYAKSITDDGFSSSISLTNEADVYKLVIEGAKYADKDITIDVHKKFVIN